MKVISTILLFAILISSIAAASALSTDLQESYRPSETMLIKISGNIAGQIDSGQVFFKRNNIFVPVEYEVSRVGSNWYIWAVAPQNENNYTLIIEDVLVSSGSGTTLEDYTGAFRVTGDKKEYTLRPGFIVASGDFDIEAELNTDSALDIEVSFPSDRTITLQPGLNNIHFDTSSVAGTALKSISVGYYSVPAYIFIAGSTAQNEENTTEQNSTAQNSTNASAVNNTNAAYSNIKVTPAYVQKYMYKSSIESTYAFNVTNENSLIHKNLKILYNDTIFDVDDDTFSLKANQNYTFEVTLKKGITRDIKEKIYINGSNVSIEIPFFVRFTDNASDIAEFYGENYRNTSLNQTLRRTSLLCSEMGGAVCSSGSECAGETLQSKDGSCCIGVCQQPEKTSYAWVGWIIAFAVLAIGWFAYYKYKKTAA